MISSQEDDRFGPISLKELPNLQVAVSLLVNFKHLPNDKLLNGWTIGKHGIEISFEADDYYSATFLPEVAEEEGWDHQTTMDYLIEKSGYSGTFQEIKSSIKAKTYESIKTKLSY